LLCVQRQPHPGAPNKKGPDFQVPFYLA